MDVASPHIHISTFFIADEIAEIESNRFCFIATPNTLKIIMSTELFNEALAGLKAFLWLISWLMFKAQKKLFELINLKMNN